MASLISAISWVPRGAAAQHPRKYALDEAELNRVGKLAGQRLEVVREELAAAEKAQGGDGGPPEGDDEWEEWAFRLLHVGSELIRIHLQRV